MKFRTRRRRRRHGLRRLGHRRRGRSSSPAALPLMPIARAIRATGTIAMAARAKGPGRRFVTTLWSQMSSSDDRYHIDPNVHSYQCDKYANATYSMYAFVLMRRYPWENVRPSPHAARRLGDIRSHIMSACYDGKPFRKLLVASFRREGRGANMHAPYRRGRMGRSRRIAIPSSASRDIRACPDAWEKGGDGMANVRDAIGSDCRVSLALGDWDHRRRSRFPNDAMMSLPFFFALSPLWMHPNSTLFNGRPLP
jgi:hypothetical protein